MGITNVAIFGVGGVGGYFGGKLCQLLKDGHHFNISFVARGEHLRAIQQSGLLLSSETDGDILCKPSLATDNCTDLPPLDLCLICVKEFDLHALARLRPLVSDQTIVVPLLNGIDVYTRVRSMISNGPVLPACVYVGTHMERPGKVVQKGGACQILFGPDPLHPGFGPDEISNLFHRAGIKSEWTLNIQSEIWKKFIFICAYGLVGAAYGRTLGQILEDEALKNDVYAIILEAICLAKGSGVSLPEDIAEASLFKARTFPYEATTSFHRDFERADKPDERDLFSGAMIRIAEQLRIDIPKTKELAHVLEKRKPARKTD